MTRAEHITWTKTRALNQPGGPNAIPNAITSFQTDLTKHPETVEHTAIARAGMLAFGGHLQTTSEVREFIEGIR
jgi:hypothetical protein